MELMNQIRDIRGHICPVVVRSSVDQEVCGSIPTLA